MRPLPRLFAFTDHRVRTGPRTGAHAAALAGVGPALALVARDPEATAADLSDFALALLGHTRTTEAALVVAGRPDLAQAIGAHGVHLRIGDLPPGDARKVFPKGWIGRSVHTVEEGQAAIDEGADYLVAGPVYETPTHPGMTPSGLGLIEGMARLDRPVIAIGGIAPDNVAAVREAGAWGVASISALWNDPRPARVAMLLLEPWVG